METPIVVHKQRATFGDNLEYHSWKYHAVLPFLVRSSSKDFSREGVHTITEEVESIDELAKMLAKVTPDYREWSCVGGFYQQNVPNTTLFLESGMRLVVQHGQVSDEELGELAVLVLKYKSQLEQQHKVAVLD